MDVTEFTNMCKYTSKVQLHHEVQGLISASLLASQSSSTWPWSTPATPPRPGKYSIVVEVYFAYFLMINELNKCVIVS